jgi:muramidase (phage lysozyme)
MARISVSEAGGPSVCAGLDMLAWSEIGAPLLAASDDGYNVIVGSTAKRPILFNSYADHPRQLIVLNAGLKSTAAGRYQDISPTWDGLRKKLGLRDFSPINQDRGCVELLRECGALPHLIAANLTHALELMVAAAKGGSIWASLPSSTAGQHVQKMTDLAAAFGAALAKYESPLQALGIS